MTVTMKTHKIAIIGIGIGIGIGISISISISIGYIDLPLAVDFGKQFDALGLDINTRLRVAF